MPSRLRLIGGLVVAAAAMTTVAACTGTTSGSPTVSSPASTGSRPGDPTATSGGSLPQRPREITLDGVDPCTLWTAEQLSQLALSAEPRRNTTTAGDAMCAFDAQDRQPPKLSLNVAVVLDHDAADQFSPEQGDVIVSVAGFPAVQQSASAAGPRPCVVIVGTAQGQSMDVTLNYGSTEGHLAGERACELTVKAATFAMQTLQTQR